MDRRAPSDEHRAPLAGRRNRPRGLRSWAVIVVAVACGLLVQAAACALLVQAAGCTPRTPPSSTAGTPGFTPGRPWDGRGAGNMSQAEAEAFAEFPLWWLGPEFGGYHLTSIDHYDRRVVFVYGSCTAPPPRPGLRIEEGRGCYLPMQVHVFSICYPHPSTWALRHPSKPFRDGALTTPLDRALRVHLWTGVSYITVSVYAAEPSLEAALMELHGLGANTARAGERLPPPDLSRC
jgi:hypothetical protein